MKHMFFEAMTKGQFLSEASIKFLNLKDMIEQFTDEVNGLPVGNNKSVRMKGIFALLNLLALCWKLESAQIKDKDVDFLQLKVYLVHAYNCEYVDFFLDVVLKLADRFSSVNFFETAKVLRLLYQERLSNMEQNKTPSSRITQMTVFLRKSKVKWFGLELKNMEILWSVHEKSKVGEAFKYKDAHWKMQSILTDLKIDEDCHFEILDKADSAKKHFQNIQKLCKDIASFEEKCLCLDANNASFDNKLKVYQDWVVLKAKLMEGTSHELLSLFEENEHLKCTLIMKTIQMMEAFKPIAKKEESEAMFYL